MVPSPLLRILSMSLICFLYLSSMHTALGKEYSIEEIKSEANMVVGRSVLHKDINQDGHPEIFEYIIRLLDSEKIIFAGSMEVIDGKTSQSTARHFLLSHHFMMNFGDLKNLLETERHGLTLAEWIKDFFSFKFHYGPHFSNEKLRRDDIIESYVEFFAKRTKTDKKKVYDLILSQKENKIFFYRAGWREELIDLVFVPELNMFMRYDDGPY